MKNKSLNVIWIMFAIFMALFCVNLFTEGTQTATQRMWFLMDIWVVLLSIILLFKHKVPSRKGIITSLTYGLAVSLAYINNSYFSLALATGVTVLSSLAVFSVFEKYSETRLYIIHKEKKSSILISILLGLTIGIVWGMINYFLMLSSNELKFSINVINFLVALSPAIFEEIAMRTVFFVYCLSLLKGNIVSRSEKFTCWFMMMVPHVLIHTPDIFINKGFLSGIISVVLYIAIFALPFAFLQRKRDIASAMIAHGTVDIIRFCFFGLPY